MKSEGCELSEVVTVTDSDQRYFHCSALDGQGMTTGDLGWMGYGAVGNGD